MAEWFDERARAVRARERYFGVLEPAELEVVRVRYFGDAPLKLGDVAVRVGRSQSRVQQLDAMAMMRLGIVESPPRPATRPCADCSHGSQVHVLVEPARRGVYTSPPMRARCNVPECACPAYRKTPRGG